MNYSILIVSISIFLVSHLVHDVRTKGIKKYTKFEDLPDKFEDFPEVCAISILIRCAIGHGLGDESFQSLAYLKSQDTCCRLSMTTQCLRDMAGKCKAAKTQANKLERAAINDCKHAGYKFGCPRLSKGAIAGIVIGIIVVVALIVAAAIYYFIIRKKSTTHT